MSKTKPPAAAKGAASGKQRQLVVIPLDDRIPAMTDRELKTLRENAERLAASGGDFVQATAQRLLPLISSEFEARATASAEALQTRCRKPRKSKAETGPATGADG